MSRLSTDMYKGGFLVDGYDYHNQAWVLAGRYVRCGHPESMACNCYGRLHEGERCTSKNEIEKGLTMNDIDNLTNL